MIEYFLGLFFALQIVSETLRAFTLNDELHYILDLGKVEMVCGYIGYFVMGYYLAHIGIGDRIKKILYALVVPSMVANVVLGVLLAWRVNVAVATIYDSFGIFTFILSVSLFVFVCERGKKAKIGESSSRLLKEMSANTFGIYIMHIGFMEFTKNRGFHSMIMPNIIGIPLYAVACFAICSFMAAIIRRIPFVGRFLC